MRRRLLLFLMATWILGASASKSQDTQEMCDLFFAVQRGNVSKVEAILKEHPERIKGTFGRKPFLYEAAENGNTNMISVLLKHGADIEVRYFQANFSPLCIAIHNGHKTAVQLLLENKTNVEGIYHSGRTPLFLCTTKEMIELLVKYKANVDARDVLKRTPLHWAVRGANVEAVETLLQNGADAEARDRDDATPLVVADQTNVRNSLGIIDGPYTPSPREEEELRDKLAKIKALLRHYGAKK